MGLFRKRNKPGRQRDNFKSAAAMVEQFIGDLGLHHEDNRLPTEDGTLAWGLMRGSAQVYIFIRPGAEDDEFNTVQIVSPVMRVPVDDAIRLLLYEHLLSLNAQELTGAGFAVKDETVVIIADRSTEDLDPSEVRDMVLRVGYFADVYDDALVSQFGGRRYSD